jgi:hypothetical protein
MLAKCNVGTLEYTNTSHSVTLVPRLEYSINLLDEIVEILKKKRNDLKKSNKSLVVDFDETNDTHLKAIKLERTMAFSLEILSQIKKRTGRISDVNSIPKVLPPAIPLIRTISAQLFDIVPHCSQKLSELSVHLGSILLDSAALTKARFDFSQSNEEASTLHNEVKLMVDCKINKQYPNLDFFKVCNT